MRSVSTSLLICLIHCLVATHAVAAAPPRRPNILFVLIDDMGYRDLSCYGSTRVDTPEIDRPGLDNSWPDLAIRDGDWKLLIFRDGSKPELFNVIDDPRESTNLAEKHPKRVERLSTAVIEWDRSIGKTRLETGNENPQTR